LGIPKIIFSPESHHPPHPCISGEIRHHPSAQLVVLFVVVSSFSRVVAISPSTPCLLLDKFTAPEFRKVARELSDLFFPSPSRSCARARARRLCSAAARHRAASYRAQNPILRRRADWSSEPPPRGRSVAPPPSSNHLGASRRGRGTRRPVSPSLALVSARSCSPSPPPRNEPPRAPLRP